MTFGCSRNIACQQLVSFKTHEDEEAIEENNDEHSVLIDDDDNDDEEEDKMKESENVLKRVTEEGNKNNEIRRK